MNRCSHTLRIYCYPDSMLQSTETSDEAYMDRRQAAKEYETTDPSQACLFFPPVNTLCSHNRCSPVSLIQNMRLRALPYWNSGRNHILFDTSDHEEAHFTPSHAIVVRSNFLQWSYRHGFDVSGPLEQHDSRPHTIGQGVRWRDAHSNWPKERERHQVRPVINRTWHVFLRSSCTHPIRLELARLLHDVRLKRIVLVSDKFMTGVATSCTGMAARPADLEIYRQYAKTTTQYQHEMMSDSVFGLVPPGTGEHSMRLLEVMEAGLIPIIVREELVLPFVDLIRWEDISLVVKFSEISSIPRLVEELMLKPTKLMEMQRRGQEAYYQFFHFRESHYHYAFLTAFQRAPKILAMGNNPAVTAVTGQQ
jgi:glucuronyl/N-acetylglucosaminyl transferase EXT1